jgi:hypothetical protein
MPKLGNRAANRFVIRFITAELRAPTFAEPDQEDGSQQDCQNQDSMYSVPFSSVSHPQFTSHLSFHQNRHRTDGDGGFVRVDRPRDVDPTLGVRRGYWVRR